MEDEDSQSALFDVVPLTILHKSYNYESFDGLNLTDGVAYHAVVVGEEVVAEQRCLYFIYI